jgi:hypothetical protein
LQTTLNEKKQARVHDRVMELLVDVQRRVFPTVSPSKIVELFKLGEGNPPTLGIKTADVVDGFYSFLGFPRLVDSAAIKKAIARRHPRRIVWLLLWLGPALGSDAKYQVPLVRVRFNTAVRDDEIDMDSGFIMMPQAVPVPAPLPVTGGEPPNVGGYSGSPTPPPGSPGGVAGPAITSPSPGGATAQKTVEISFSADQSALRGLERDRKPR